MRRLLAVAAAVALAAAGLLAWLFLPRDTSTPVAAGAGSPDVLTYATTGFEEVDALGGARHEYPARTTIAVRREPGGCRVFGWRPLEERLYRWEACGSRLRGFTELHRFFGRDDRRVYRCDEGSSFRDGWDCEAESTRETAVVVSSAGGRVLLRTTLSGSTTGTGTRELWLRDDGVPLRMIVENESATPTPLGDVRYRERFELRLVRPSPG